MLDEKLIELKKEIVEYATLVEKMVKKSLEGLLLKDRQALLEVMQKDEPRVNAYEIDIDELCTNLIAQYQPRAKNLRIILMVLKMSNDLERMGDHAVNIVESALFLSERPDVKPLVDIPKMGELVTKMLSDGINSFVNEDAELAKSVCKSDNLVDDLKDKVFLELSRIMGQDPSTIERSLHLLRISGNLERIADLSTNLCEDVMFVVEGRVIKHHREEQENAR
ncbi:MAG TPA: phosphate transport system regulatory protein PhoU [Elusimicrobia bacterium]|nr:MAG: phosphate transport system regulatory protein PhoU [Elusimicrobia bacterium RIFOXYA12_FULL_49_49]OGS09185.1 MAG: phosphate transport system regulatory protein PhoU [Elusimicrobia bacterium RIFOXYA1_FULL_47_7]OGS09874.1 MAG: phosphate transport system regulatory protein PhoU [Elusimicrobia bacterium RIFOXYB1_FULL_48_9]OGS14996.1 MAG: phosphate transport system regulatory protein PhoU [Elusimicrobia bacterium RIFOXYA2_FULL_47_53]OGS26069.1 MAG: phosphate transport system regulatory protei